ncbi:MAG: HTTM domain-containing protein [Planctomycetaceae bacterium]|nr:HTTM domain-containing protein [Planctomycetaceae bacterium]
MSRLPHFSFDSATSRLQVLGRIVPLFVLLLTCLTWPLWWGDRSFPLIPLLPGLGSCPLWIDRGLVLLLIPALLGISLVPEHSPIRNKLFLIAPSLILLLVILNQHRIQTWSYQYGLMLLLIGCRSPSNKSPVSSEGLSPERIILLFRFLIASIYIYSALSKLDMHFISGGGFFLSKSMLDLLGIDYRFWSETKLSYFTCLLPMFELLVGFGLLFRRTRTFALTGSLLLHLALLSILGPLGLNHSNGVLAWNACFIVQNLILFRFTRRSQPEVSTSSETDSVSMSTSVGGKKRFAAYSLFGLAILLPLLEPWGFCDHWLGWAVYTSRQERFLLLMEETDQQPFPEELLPHLSPPEPLTSARRLNLNSWSLQTCHVPVYPQTRFQWGLWLDLHRRYPQLKMQAILERPLDRLSTDRQTETFSSNEQIEALHAHFMLNSVPRFLPE